MHPLKLAFGSCILLAMAAPVHAQGKFLKKVSNAANNVLNTVNSGGNNSSPAGGTPAGELPNASPSSSGRPTNKAGLGLIATPPDVAANLTTSESAYATKNYGEARYALQQAMLGVELQIGQSILKALPEEILSLPRQAQQDQVASTGWGWAGLIIKREYQKEDKALTINITNNAMWMQAINMYLTSGMMNQSMGGQQNWKQTRLKNNRAVIEYDESSGYKLSVPLGQSTLFMLEGVNFANEQEFMKAAEAVDIEKIKDLLNEK
ncbi:hypothetical protein SAMN05444008_10442 [Cnuella takakiae]|uniref:Uncharacterized protein n=1 Tax=Cnuella takakiae TaxID=1302690 RepID=A0A1M4XU27_9BACT|nr:hypothetical protein [Cnuella takakiae]SHE97009.1 hypothetical protein SAMN05444008_10442 [Cnuella takakiae]